MTFLEPIIAAILGAGITALAVFFKTNGFALAVLKHGNLIKKAYDIIDPILDKNISKWSGSQVDTAFELVIESVGDGKLSQAEIKAIAIHMGKAWLPAAAAEKVRLFEKEDTDEKDITKAEEIITKVNNS
tara:strand:+ start:2742 stop:3131 length:390 start_codon:yes stop_codon:yes gene_type:complete